MRATKKSLKPSHHYGLMIQSIKKFQKIILAAYFSAVLVLDCA